VLASAVEVQPTAQPVAAAAPAPKKIDPTEFEEPVDKPVEKKQAATVAAVKPAPAKEKPAPAKPKPVAVATPKQEVEAESPIDSELDDILAKLDSLE